MSATLTAGAAAALAGGSILGDMLNTGYSAALQRVNREDTQEFNAEQAAISRDWQEYMRDTQVESLRKQGINASMYYGGGGGLSATPTAANASASGGSSVKASTAAMQGFLNGYMKSINDGAAIGAQAAMSSAEMANRIKVAEINNRGHHTLTFNSAGDLLTEQIQTRK